MNVLVLSPSWSFSREKKGETGKGGKKKKASPLSGLVPTSLRRETKRNRKGGKKKKKRGGGKKKEGGVLPCVSHSLAVAGLFLQVKEASQKRKRKGKKKKGGRKNPFRVG